MRWRSFSVLLLTTSMLGAPLGAQPQSQTPAPNPEEVLAALKTIDPNILRYFPRWRLCEPNLMIQVHQTFVLLGYPETQLDMQNIVLTAAPTRRAGEEYELLLIECGSAKMVASEIEANMRKLASLLADPRRPYCYEEIPPSTPPTPAQVEAIVNFTMPTNVGQAVTVSLFEQTLKLGRTGFWLRASVGSDALGYHFWSAGIGRVILQRPLIENTDESTRRAIPHLLDARLGVGYRLTGGLDEKFLGGILAPRKLNIGYGGYLSAGADFYFPFHPQAGTALTVELPLQSISPTTSVNLKTYATVPIGTERDIRPTQPDLIVDLERLVPLLRSSGQWTLFYNWWLSQERPIHFFRFDIGLCYSEVREAAIIYSADRQTTFLSTTDVEGLQLYKPRELGDWLFLRLEYRNQSSFPFGVALQYSNQLLFGRIYLPIVGRWLYLEGKYSTPLRPLRPFETRHFFVLSPLLRITI
jgi:hypothetical protein